MDGPFIVLFEQNRADEADEGVLVGGRCRRTSVRLNLAVDAFE